MNKVIKALLISVFALAAIVCVGYRNSSQSAPFSEPEVGLDKTEDYVGSEACKDCHEDQF